VKVFGFTGPRNSGKTTVVEKIAEKLVNEGYRVGYIKHAGREEFIDVAGKDTSRLRDSGAARRVVIAGSESAIFMEPLELTKAYSFFGGFDYVLVEGFRRSYIGPRIVVARKIEDAIGYIDELTVGIVLTGTTQPSGSYKDIPIFSLEDVDKVANLVKTNALNPLPGLNCGKCGFKTCRGLMSAIIRGEASIDHCVTLKALKEVRLRVDDVYVPLNPFVAGLLRNILIAFISSLKGVKSKPNKIEVIVLE